MKNTKLTAALLTCVIALTGCSNAASAKPIITIGDTVVNEGVFGFFFNQYIPMLSGDVDSAKDYAIRQCTDNYKAVAVARAMGLEFDEETQKQFDDEKQQVIDSQQNGYKKFLKESGLTDDDVNDILSSSFYADMLKKEMEEYTPTEEDKREYFKNNYRRAKHILIPTKDTMTQTALSEEEQEAAKKTAEELLERAKSGEDFDALVSEYSEDPGSASNPDGYVFTDGDMVPEFEEGVDSIGIGEFTLVESTYGYHVIERLALDETPEYFDQEYEKVAENLDSVIENDRFMKQLDVWCEEYGLEVVNNDEAIDKLVEAAKKEQKEEEEKAAKEAEEAAKEAQNSSSEETQTQENTDTADTQETEKAAE